MKIKLRCTFFDDWEIILLTNYMLEKSEFGKIGVEQIFYQKNYF